MGGTSRPHGGTQLVSRLLLWWFQRQASILDVLKLQHLAAAHGDAHCPLASAPQSSLYMYIPLLRIYFFHMWLIFLFFSDVLMQFLSTATEALWMLIGNSIAFLCVLGYLSRLLLGLSCKSSGKNVKEEIVCVCVCTGDQTQDPSVHEAGNCSLFSREIGCRYEEALGAMSGTYCFIHGLCQRCLPGPAAGISRCCV